MSGKEYTGKSRAGYPSDYGMVAKVKQVEPHSGSVKRYPKDRNAQDRGRVSKYPTPKKGRYK
jgi:hypothetical protein